MPRQLRLRLGEKELLHVASRERPLAARTLPVPRFQRTLHTLVAEHVAALGDDDVFLSVVADVAREQLPHCLHLVLLLPYARATVAGRGDGSTPQPIQLAVEGLQQKQKQRGFRRKQTTIGLNVGFMHTLQKPVLEQKRQTREKFTIFLEKKVCAIFGILVQFWLPIPIPQTEPCPYAASNSQSSESKCPNILCS